MLWKMLKEKYREMFIVIISERHIKFPSCDLFSCYILKYSFLCMPKEQMQTFRIRATR